MARLGGVAVAGAAYRGVGHPGLHRQRAGGAPAHACWLIRPAAPAAAGSAAPLAGRRAPAGPVAAPVGWWPLAFVGAGLLYWRLAGLRRAARLLAGWLAGLGCFVPRPAWARAFNWYGAVVLMAVEALFIAAAAALDTPPARARARPSWAPSPWPRPLRMTWPFGGLPLGGVFLGQADGPLVSGPARRAPPAHRRGLGGRGGRRHARRVVGWAAGTAPAAFAVVGVVVVACGIVALGGRRRLAPDGGRPVRARCGSPWSKAGAGGA